MGQIVAAARARGDPQLVPGRPAIWRTPAFSVAARAWPRIHRSP